MNTDDWWKELMDGNRQDGREDADAGIYSPPYPHSDDPQDEAENTAYKQGWDARRKELGDKFKWL